MRITSNQAKTGHIEKYIGSAYDNVKRVADSIDAVNELASTVEGVNLELLAQVLENLGDSVSDLAALAQADLIAISDDLGKGNYLGNRKIDIDLNLNNTSDSIEVTYQGITLVSNQGVVIQIDFTVPDPQGGDPIVTELASYTAIYNALIAGIEQFNANEPDAQLHIRNTEMDIINSTLPNLPTMIRLRDLDGYASNIDRLRLQVYSGDAIDVNPAYYWAKTTSALQTLANRVGDVIALGNDIDSIIALSILKDEIEYLYANRDALTLAPDSLYSQMSKLQVLHAQIDGLVNVHTNMTDVLDVRDNLGIIETVATNIQAVINSYQNALDAIAAANAAALSEANALQYSGEALVYRNEAEGFKNQAQTLTQNLQAIDVQQTITGAAGTNASVVYNSSTNKFTFVVPQGIKGDRGEAFQVNAVGLFADRALYDDRLKGFSFLALDQDTIYFKLSNTVADWSAGAAFGKGDTGTPGDTGNGIAAIVFTNTTDPSGLAAQNGATDTYTVTFTDGTTTTFPVYNGLNSLVESVQGRIGNVVITAQDIGLKNVDNTSDANKPISTATQQALNLLQTKAEEDAISMAIALG